MREAKGMSFLIHLEELRWHLVKSSITIIGVIITLIFIGKLLPNISI